MLSMEQLAQTVKEHLGLYNCVDGIQHSCKWTVGDSSLGGRGLIATEDISSGEVLFVDHPLIYGPRSGSIQPRGCTVCCKLDCDAFFKCAKCALLLCSEQCQKTTIHADDCKVISRWNKKVPVEDIDDALMSRALTPVRALLLNDDQKLFMSCLQAHNSPQHGHEVRDLNQYFDIPEEQEQLMSLACCILDTTAYQIATAFGKNEMSLRGLYPVAGLMNHNCVSNTRYTYNSELQMTLKAVKPIRAGTEIFTCYTGPLWGTPARRTHLYKTKHFLCNCDRCADPTERGTLLAALKCFATQCPGVLLPVEPLKLSTAWRCIECGLRVPNDNICTVQAALGSLMGSLNFDNVGDLENFLVNRITKYIPRTNQIVVDLHCRLIWAFGDTDGCRWHGQERRWFVNGRLQSAASFAGPTMVPERAFEQSREMDITTEKHLDDISVQRNWVIKGSKLGGRGVFASKKIQPGTLILENRALVIGPRADCADKTFCTVCYKLCDTFKCDKCGLLMCSEQCESSTDHGLLCSFIANNWTPKPNFEHYSEILARALIFIRSSLLENEQKYLLNVLQKNGSTSTQEEIEALRSIYVIPEEQLRFMSVVNSIIKVNSFRIPSNPRAKTVPLRSLYPISSFLNHSCVPNTRNIFKEDYTMSIYASREIEIGEEITTCYTGLLWSTPARRCQLFQSKKFWCKCERCRDRTEMATNLSALKCLDKECVGVLLPISPTDPRTEWSCDNCNSKVEASKISAVQSVLGSLVGTLDLDDQFRLETCVLERLAKFIPYTNHIFVDLRLRLTLRIGFTGIKLNGNHALFGILVLLLITCNVVTNFAVL